MPNRDKWQIHKVAGRWVVRLPDYIGPWLFTFPTWDICLVFMDGVEIYYHNHPEWHFTYQEIKQSLAVAKEIGLIRSNG
jgi:hypothetical protein